MLSSRVDGGMPGPRGLDEWRNPLLSSPRSDESTFPLVCPPIDIGAVATGEPLIVRQVWPLNQSTRPVSIRRLEISCECLKAEFFPGEVLPGRKSWISLSLDPSEKTEFAGHLGIIIDGYAEDGEHILSTTFNIELVDGANERLSFEQPLEDHSVRDSSVKLDRRT